jgi:hypothetical protein
MAWNTLCPGNGRTECSVVQLTRSPSANPDHVRAPLKSYGGSIRVNMLGFVILRLDVTKPMDRPNRSAYWTVSLGPTF